MHEVTKVKKLIYAWGTIYEATCSCGWSVTAKSRNGAKGKVSRHVEFHNVSEATR